MPAVVAVPDRLILELKYRGRRPRIFKQLVEEFALVPQTASKYRLGVVALGLAQPYPVSARARIEALYA